MSRAEEFRQSTEQFWSQMDRKRKLVAADRKPRATSSGNTLKKLSVGRTSPKMKKERSIDRSCAHVDASDVGEREHFRRQQQLIVGA